METVTSDQLRARLQGNPRVVLLDVRIPEAYAIAHLPGALHCCAFQVSFVEDVRRLIPDPASPVIVYGTAEGSLESNDAAHRLVEAGYTQVANFIGGLARWKADGLPTDGDPSRSPVDLAGEVAVDLEQTRVEWTGRNLLNKHSGTVGVTSGSLKFSEGWLVSGALTIDMTAIRCTDVTDEKLNAALIAHLKSPDFFDVSRHPEAQLVIKKTAPIPNGRPGVPNLHLLCDFTLRGITRELPIVAIAGRTSDGRIAAQAVFALDRTQWGSAYGSSRFFLELGQHLVNDLVEIQVRVVGRSTGLA